MPGYLGLGNLSIAVNQPWWLILMPILIPPLIWASYRGLAGLGKVRRILALLFRATVVTLIILALAEVQMIRRNDKLTTIYLLDVSESIPREWQKTMIEFVNGSIKQHKRAGDLAGVIAFGKNAKVESPPTENANSLLGLETQPEKDYTDLSAAIKLALATFPEDTMRRIVVLSDGNENRGNAFEQALSAAKLNVQIDALPITYRYDHEVLVERVSIPPDVKKGETVRIDVVIRASESTGGTLQIYQKADNSTVPAAGNEEPEHVTLRRGINVFSIKQTITEPNFYAYSAVFVPDKGSGDVRQTNNRAESFTYARGTAQVLLIEGTSGEHLDLVKALREKGLEVVVKVAPQISGAGPVGGDPDIPTDISELQKFDAVILGNVPKDSFSEAQIQMFEANVHDMAGGLIMLGGPNSFGAGGWRNTPVEKALPVDMDVKSMKVQGKSAVALVMHATEIPEGNFWMKMIAQEAVKTLSPFDYCGMLYWNGNESWLFKLQSIGENRSSMLRAIDRMNPSDMPDFGTIVQMAQNGLMKDAKDAMTRHMIIISDGDPAPPSNRIIQQLVKNKITVTTVLTAAHGNDFGSFNVMRNIAQRTHGRFYNVTNPKSLPRIYSQEMRLVSRPLIFEQNDRPWLPLLDHSSEPLVGIPSKLPPITGLVLTSAKEGTELVDIPILSPLPTGLKNPLLAHWTYGLGRSLAWTSDAGARWSKAWPDWNSYSAFWAQLVRWSLRPVDRGNLTLNVRREDGKLKVIVDALDKDNQYLNFLQIRGSVVTPDSSKGGAPVELAQTAPGRYEGMINEADAPGNYFVTLAYSGPDGTPGFARAGVSVPYSEEYKELQSNPENLRTLVDQTDGKTVDWHSRGDGVVDVAATLDDLDVFRRDPSMKPPSSFRDLWPDLLWMAVVLFLADVAIRRISPDFVRMKRAVTDGWKKLRGQEVALSVDYMDKLKGRKAEVAEQIERTRSSTRFEPPTPLPEGTGPIGEPLLEGDAPASTRKDPERPTGSSGPSLAPASPKPAEGESYTNRLLRAKQKVWEDREKDKNNPSP